MYGVLGNKLIGPFVFDNNLTWNAYEVFLRNELPDLLEDIPLMIWNQMYFQHDGTPPHYTRHVRDYLNESIPNRWLGRGGPVAWPPRLPDLTPLDKRNHPNNTGSATQSLLMRAENCIAAGGGHFQQLL